LLALLLVAASITAGCNSAAWRGPSHQGPLLAEMPPDELLRLDESRITTEEHYTNGVAMADGRGGVRMTSGYWSTVSLYKLSSGATVDEHAGVVIHLVDGSIAGVTLPARITSDGATVTIVKGSNVQAIPRAQIASVAYHTEVHDKPQPRSRARTIVGLVLIGVLTVVAVGALVLAATD